MRFLTEEEKSNQKETMVKAGRPICALAIMTAFVAENMESFIRAPLIIMKTSR